MTGCAIMPDLLHLLGLIVITSPGGEGRGHLEVAEAALAGGCRAVQLRDKRMGDREFAGVALRVKELCRPRDALLFVNDRVDVAAAVGADGVHLGVADLAVADARRLLPPLALIGFSPEDEAEARLAVAEGASYLGIGPVEATPTKGDAGEPIGIEGLARWCGKRIAPVIAVGGIGARNAAAAMEAGAAGVAASSAITGAADMERATRELLAAVERKAGASG